MGDGRVQIDCGGARRGTNLKALERRGTNLNCTLHSMPYIIYPTPPTLHHTHYTIHLAPYSLHPTPCTLHHTPCMEEETIMGDGRVQIDCGGNYVAYWLDSGP